MLGVGPPLRRAAIQKFHHSEGIRFGLGLGLVSGLGLGLAALHHSEWWPFGMVDLNCIIVYAHITIAS